MILNNETGRKVPAKPSLDKYDNARPATAAQSAAAGFTSDGFSQEFLADAPRTHAFDKALLVSLGVNGEVPLAQAWQNVLHARVANDNHRQAAIAA